MALTDSEGASPFTMPVQPMYGGYGYSYAEDMEATKDEMRELAQKMPEEHRRKIERALDELR